MEQEADKKMFTKENDARKIEHSEQSPNELCGKRVVIVGASSSVGQLTTEKFIAHRAKVLASTHKNTLSQRDQSRAKEAYLDLTNNASIEKFSSAGAYYFGKIDILVILAAVLPGKKLDDYDEDLLNEVMTVNFTGQANLIRQLKPHFSENSLITLVSSISGLRGSYDPIYSSAKAAQIGLVKSLASSLAPKTRINAIAPGLIKDSTMYNSMAPDRRLFHLEQSPTGRLTTKTEVAGIILGLCQPEWANVNGQVIQINGGVNT